MGFYFGKSFLCVPNAYVEIVSIAIAARLAIKTITVGIDSIVVTVSGKGVNACIVVIAVFLGCVSIAIVIFIRAGLLPNSTIDDTVEVVAR